MDQKDILNALHICFTKASRFDCQKCRYYWRGCATDMMRDAANEISRLQAGLLELKEDIEDELSMRECKF